MGHGEYYKKFFPITFPEETKFHRNFSGYFVPYCCRTKVSQRIVLVEDLDASNWLKDRFTMSGITLDPQIFLKSCFDFGPSSACSVDGLGLHVVPAFKVLSPVFALNEPSVTHSFLLLLGQVSQEDRTGSFLDEFLDMGNLIDRQVIANKDNSINFGLHFRHICVDLELITSALRNERSTQRRQLVELYSLILFLVGLVQLPDEEALPAELIAVGSQTSEIAKNLAKKHQVAIATDYCYLKFMNYDLWTRS